MTGVVSKPDTRGKLEILSADAQYDLACACSCSKDEHRQRSDDGKWIYPLDKARCKAEGAEQLAWPDDTTTPDSGNVVEHQTDTHDHHAVVLHLLPFGGE